MIRFLYILLFFTATLLTHAQQNEAGAIVAVDTPPQQLIEIREGVRSQGPIHGQFREERSFPFRKEAVVLEGELVYAPEQGLSLLYLKPDERRIVVSGGQVRIQDADGDEETRQLTSRFAFLEPVLAFDIEALAKDFRIQFSSGNVWELSLRPLPDLPAGPRNTRNQAGETIRVRGAGASVTEIEISRPGAIQIRIFITETKALGAESAATSARFFGP